VVKTGQQEADVFGLMQGWDDDRKFHGEKVLFPETMAMIRVMEGGGSQLRIDPPGRMERGERRRGRQMRENFLGLDRGEGGL